MVTEAFDIPMCYLSSPPVANITFKEFCFKVVLDSMLFLNSSKTGIITIKMEKMGFKGGLDYFMAEWPF